MLKIFKDNNKNNYLFIIYKEIIKKNYYEGKTAYYGLEYHRNEKRISLTNGWLLDENKYIKPLELYELVFNDNNILKEIKRKIKRKIKFLNKKTNQILTQSDFLFILLLQEIEKYEKEIKEII